jgi:hypothetical protein
MPTLGRIELRRVTTAAYARAETESPHGYGVYVCLGDAHAGSVNNLVADAASRRYLSECLAVRGRCGSSSRCQELGSTASGDFSWGALLLWEHEEVIRRMRQTMCVIKRRSI